MERNGIKQIYMNVCQNPLAIVPTFIISFHVSPPNPVKIDAKYYWRAKGIASNSTGALMKSVPLSLPQNR